MLPTASGQFVTQFRASSSSSGSVGCIIAPLRIFAAAAAAGRENEATTVVLLCLSVMFVVILGLEISLGHQRQLRADLTGQSITTSWTSVAAAAGVEQNRRR